MTSPKPITYEGETFSSRKELWNCKAKANIPYHVFIRRISKEDWEISTALTTPTRDYVNEEVFHVDGRDFATIAELARAFGVKVSTAQARFRQGWSHEEIAKDQKKLPPSAKSVRTKTQVFPTKRKFAEYLGIHNDVLGRYFRLGLTPDEIVDRIKGRGIEFRGIKYKSIAEAARTYGLNSGTVRNRLNKNWPLEEVFGIKNRPTGTGHSDFWEIDGLTFYSVAAMARHFGINEKTLHNRLKRGKWTTEQAVGLMPSPLKCRRRKPVVVKGKRYLSLSQCAEAHGISHNLLHHRLARIWTLEQALGIVSPPIEQGPIPVECEGERFDSIAALGRQYGIEKSVLNKRIKTGCSIEEAVGIRRDWVFGIPIVIDSINFPSHAAAESHFGVTEGRISRMMAIGATPEQAVGLEDYYHENRVEIGGRTYKTLKQAALENGIDYENQFVRRYYYNDWSLEQALGLEPPPDQILSKGIYSKRFFEKHPKLKDTPAVIYFILIEGTRGDIYLHKIGITIRTFEARYQSSSGYLVTLLHQEHLNLYQAWQIESEILRDFEKNKEIGPRDFPGRTECFKLSDTEVVNLILRLKQTIESPS